MTLLMLAALAFRAPAMHMSAATDRTALQLAEVPLAQLLSTCIDASQRGCAAIRRVHATLERECDVVSGECAIINARDTDYKIEGDPRSALTAADLAAQRAVVDALERAWPGLRVVGEEDLSVGEACASPLGGDVEEPGELRRDLCVDLEGREPRVAPHAESESAAHEPRWPPWGFVRRPAALCAREPPLRRSGPTGRLRCAAARPVRSPPILPAIPAHHTHTTQVAPLGDITIFVDPLDGTREFVEGRVWNVQVLVGIAVCGEATAGAVGLPFASGSSDSDAAVVYGMVSTGLGLGYPDPNLNPADPNSTPTLTLTSTPTLTLTRSGRGRRGSTARVPQGLTPYTAAAPPAKARGRCLSPATTPTAPSRQRTRRPCRRAGAACCWAAPVRSASPSPRGAPTWR